MDQRDFAQEFLKYKSDSNNYALYLWGYVDLMLDFYKNRNPSLISSESVRGDSKWDRKGGMLNIYGEPGVYPQFAEKILLSEIHNDQYTTIYVIPESGEINEDWKVFFTRLGGTYLDGNQCEEIIVKGAQCTQYVKYGVSRHEYEEGWLPRVNKRDYCLENDNEKNKWAEYEGRQLYDEICRPLAVLDGPFNSRDFVYGGCHHSDKTCLSPLTP